jgi:hypothetical protein
VRWEAVRWEAVRWEAVSWEGEVEAVMWGWLPLTLGADHQQQDSAGRRLSGLVRGCSQSQVFARLEQRLL